MKNTTPLILTAFLFGGFSLSAQTAWSVMDTLTQRQIGPGVKYTHVHLPAVPVNAYIMEIDLNNPYITIETMQASDQVGKTERLTKAFDRMSSEGHKCIGGINGNFWIVPVQNYPPPLNGMPHSGSMRNGEMVSDPNGWNRGRTNDPVDILEEIGFAILDENKKLWVDDVQFDGVVELAGGNTFPIDNVNRIRNNNTLVFFNSYVGGKTRASDFAGKEVFIKPKIGYEWGTSKKVLCEVARITDGMGESEIMSGESVLSGAGSAATFLENLAVGSEVAVTMGITTRRSQDPINALQMITGNALVMKDGRLTVRNYNEEYNSMVYPRTGVGKSADGKTAYFIVMDRKTPSRGASTEVMCEILRKAGAVSACGLDGGGSAQMMIDEAIVNYPGDGSERAVANGWMLFHNAPENNTVIKIDFGDGETILPQNAAYSPLIYGYNEHGVLINKNFKEYTLSCDPEFGEIRNNTLIVNGTADEGVLTVNYNSYSVSRKIKRVLSTVRFVADSLIIDKRHDIPLSLYAIAGEKEYPVDPASVNYIIEDESICKIVAGKLLAGINGETYIYASLGKENDTLKVKVQHPDSHVINVLSTTKLEDWTITGSSNLKNPVTTLTESELNYGYTYSSGRAPNILIKPLNSLYGLPDSVNIILNTGEMTLSKLNISFSLNDGTSQTLGYENIPSNQDYLISVPADKLIENKNAYMAYPIKIDYMQGYLNTAGMESGKNYNLRLKKLNLIYNDISTSIAEVKSEPNYKLLSNQVKDNKIMILGNASSNRILDIQVVNLSGLVIRQQKSYMNHSICEVPMENINKGVYLMVLNDQNQIHTFKILIP